MCINYYNSLKNHQVVRNNIFKNMIVFKINKQIVFGVYKLNFGIISALTNDHFSRDTHMRIILGNKAVLKKSTSDTK